MISLAQRIRLSGALVKQGLKIPTGGSQFSKLENGGAREEGTGTENRCCTFGSSNQIKAWDGK
jgi:hypothetical protein